MSIRAATIAMVFVLAACGESKPAKPTGESPPPAPSGPPPDGVWAMGTVTVPDDVAIAPGATVFVILKRPGPDGQPAGMPVAAMKLAWGKATSLAFSLGRDDQMVKQGDPTGELWALARVDADGDAMTKSPGDRVGQTKFVVPAQGVRVVLDAVLP